ncbi:MAG: AMP-binding enzyme, partial [Steroidobacteraceae bacterium]
KDMILTGGYNVFPNRIERAICEHPAVAEAAVVGAAHPYFGEVAKAFIVLKGACSAFTLSQLQTFLRDKLSRNELPLALEFRASLPRTPLGKLSKNDLVDRREAREPPSGARQ